MKNKQLPDAAQIMAELVGDSSPTKQNYQAGMLTAKPANAWLVLASQRSIPKMLFSELWHEGELCILFADTGLGKSILAVQLGNSISKGEAISGFKLEAEKQTVLYFDFELSDKQFEARYSQEYTNHYCFDESFYRVEIDPEAIIPPGKTFEECLSESIEEAITQTGAKIIIIDNLTYFRAGTETAKDALPMMKELKALKRKYDLSILALAHTPKRDLSKPVTRNDLQGSKMLINFCDSCFAIGESNTDKGLRYIKQIKERATGKIYDAENVIVCEVRKHANFLCFSHGGFSSEQEHLRTLSKEDKELRKESAFELLSKGYSNREVARQLSVSESAVRKWIKQ